MTHCDRSPDGRLRRQEGFALILAILSLLLLTVLGLTLAATTTTEIQIATNYKWSQQAQMNADAGIEVAKRVLRDMEWATLLPTARSGSWADGAAPAAPAAPFSGAYRNYENAGCDTRAGQGYGAVLNNGTQRYENVSTIPSIAFPATVGGVSTRILGAFTLWVRRPVVVNQDGTLSDYAIDDDTMILTSEGTAPYTPPAGGSAFTSINRAVRFMEVRLSRRALPPCGSRGGQQGSAQAGAGFASCVVFDGNGLDGLGMTGGRADQGGN